VAASIFLKFQLIRKAPGPHSRHFILLPQLPALVNMADLAMGGAAMLRMVFTVSVALTANLFGFGDPWAPRYAYDDG